MLEQKLRQMEATEETRKRESLSLEEDASSVLLSPTRLLETSLLPATVGAVVGGSVAAVVAFKRM